MRCSSLFRLTRSSRCKRACSALQASVCKTALCNNSREEGFDRLTVRFLVPQLLSTRTGFRDTCYANTYPSAQQRWRVYGIPVRKYSQSGSTPLGGIVEVPLAQTGEGIADCELLRWFVAEGDEVDEFQALCQVQSDKASVEITSRYKGRVTRVLFGPGDIVKVGETLVEILLDGAEASVSSSKAADEDHVGEKHFSSSDDEGDVSLPGASRNVRCTPGVRRLAREHGVNLADVPATGNDDRLLKEDVMKFIAAKEGIQEDLQALLDSPPGVSLATETEDHPKEARRLVKASPDGRDFVIPIRGFRRAMAKAMTETTSVPHFYYVDEILVDSLIKLRQNLQGISLGPGVKLTYLPFMIKALSAALSKYPVMNATVNSDLTQITCIGHHNVGVAMATESGLVVPNIKNVQHLSVAEIATELSRLSLLASTNKLSPEDVSGGTISISNIGVIGGKTGSPLLNLPEVAIVAFGRIDKLPRFASDGSIIAASVLTVTWAADHRVIDGATVATFCNEWKKLLEQPERLLMQLR